MNGAAYREFMPGLPSWLAWAIYIALLPTAVAFLWLLHRRIARSGTGIAELARALRDAMRADASGVWRRLGADVFAQRRVRRDRTGARLHLLIFYSFVLLTIGTGLIGLQHDITQPLFGFEFLKGAFYLGYEVVLDTAALAFIAGTVLAMWRRYRTRPAHLGGRRSVHLVYGLLLYFGLSGLMLESLRLLANPVPWQGWSYAGDLLAKLVHPLVGAHAMGVYQSVWAVHVLVAFVAMGVVPLLMLDHILVLPLEIALQAGRQPGVLTTPFDLPAIMAAEGDLEGISAGLSDPVDLPWQRRFMLDACIDCGRCEAVCPANAAGRELSPRTLVQALGADLRTGIAAGVARVDDVFAREIVQEAAVWSCLTCGACARECPALIDQPGTIVELRRRLVELGQLDERQATTLSNLERNQNPLGLPSYQRGDWLSELGVPLAAEAPDAEYLYWIGCMASYDQRARNVAVSMIKILRHVGISFAVLGNEEMCLGESQRKLGDEAGFQLRALQNIELFQSYGVRKILTHCPHCLATLTRDYPQFGLQTEVVHHSVLLARLIEEGRLPKPADDTGPLAFHDPCNLGRLGGVFDQPRSVAKFAAGPQFVEFGRARDRSFCCGAGGANYFYKVPEETSVSALRLEQAGEVGAQTVATGCPFCLGMLEDATKKLPAGSVAPRIADLAELVAAGLPESS